MKNSTDLQERDKMRILFIAGNRAFQPIVTRFLKQCDELSLVGTVWGREQVLAQALDLRPKVILLDMDTSDRTGLASIADLRGALPGAHIIALSLLGADGYRQAVLAAGADDLVLKSNLRTDLLVVIRRAAHNSRHRQAPVF